MAGDPPLGRAPGAVAVGGRSFILAISAALLFGVFLSVADRGGWHAVRDLFFGVVVWSVLAALIIWIVGTAAFELWARFRGDVK